jgi:uncharacterized protein (DUF934 family)
MTTLISASNRIPDLWQRSDEHTLRGPDDARGLRVLGDADHRTVAAAVATAPTAELVLIEFPVYSDGRGFSLARDLRERHGYCGTLRASGEFGLDQVNELFACGFDEVALPDTIDPQEALKWAHPFAERYQVTAAQPQPLFRRRAL